jgi:hypothetical protein
MGSHLFQFGQSPAFSPTSAVGDLEKIFKKFYRHLHCKNTVSSAASLSKMLKTRCSVDLPS